MKKSSFLSGVFIGIVMCLALGLVVGYFYFGQIKKAAQDKKPSATAQESAADYLDVLNAPKTPQDLLAALDKIIKLRPRDAKAYLTKADLLNEMGDYRAAMQAYDTALALDPANAQAYLGRAIAKAMSGDYGGAAADLNIAISLNPNLAPAYYNRGVANVNMSRIIEAERDFQKAADLFMNLRDNANFRDASNALKAVKDFRLASARPAAAKKGAPIGQPVAGAVKNPKELVSVKRDTAAAQQSKSSLMASLKGSDSMLEKFRANAATNRQGDMPGLGDLGNYESAVRKTMAENKDKMGSQPKTVLDHMAQSRKKLASGDSKGALEALNSAIEMRPNDASLYNQRAALNAQNKDRAAAIADYNKALELDPNNASALMGRGQQKSLMGNNKGAVEDLENAAKAFAEKGDTKSAAEAQRVADQLSGKTTSTRANTAAQRIATEAHNDFNSGNYQAAAQKYASLAKQFPGDASIAYNEALSHARAGDNKKALEAFERSNQIEPRYESLMGAANSFTQDGDYTKARERLDAARQQPDETGRPRTNDPNLDVTSGYINIGQGKTDAAIKDFEAAIKNGDETGVPQANLGQLYATKKELKDINEGNVDEYLENFTKASEHLDAARRNAAASNDGDTLKRVGELEAYVNQILPELQRMQTELNKGR